MAEGFFITDAGTKKIAQATNKGIKVDVNTVAVGDGGDINADYNYSIESLNHEIYRKTFDENDHYEIDPNNENVIVIEFTIPDTAGELNNINEVGIFETDGTLISYGTIQNIDKHVGAEGNLYTVVLAVYIPFTNNDLEHINLVIGTDGLRELERKVTVLEEQADGFEQSIQDLEDLQGNYVEKEEGYGLSSNDFTEADKNQIYKNQVDISELIEEMANFSSSDSFINLEKRVKANEDNISSLKTDMAKKANQSSLNTTNSNLESLKTTVNKKADTTTVNGINTRLSTVESQLSGLQTALSDLSTKLENIT